MAGYQELAEIQKKLKAPKGNYNEFGKYKYRSCEDICEAVKPLLAEIGAALILDDDIVMVGDRFYIKATARIIFKDGIEVHTTAFAREELAKKGMDAAQVTGSCSSYARKYALNGLFCIDDTKDPDTMDNRNNGKAISTPRDVEDWCKAHKVNIGAVCQYYGIADVKDMTPDRYQHMNQYKNLAVELGGVA